jgi:hypothetical protein
MMQELEQFWTDGYVLKENILTDEDLQPSIDTINGRKVVLQDIVWVSNLLFLYSCMLYVPCVFVFVYTAL